MTKPPTNKQLSDWERGELVDRIPAEIEGPYIMGIVPEEEHQS